MHRLRTWLRGHPRLSVSLGLILMLWATHELLNWRMERQWQAYCREARARGVAMTIAEIIPPEIPDEENFASAPLLRQMFAGTEPAPLALPGYPLQFGDRIKGEPIDWGAWQSYFVKHGMLKETSGSPPHDVLHALEKFTSQIAEWREAAKRPRSRFPLDYEAGNSMSLGHLEYIQQVALLFSLRMRAHLAVSDSASAFEDFLDALQAHRVLLEEPILYSAVTRKYILSYIGSAVGDGLAEHCWAESELRKIAAELASVRPLREYRLAMASERVFANGIYDQLAIGSPIKRRQIVGIFYGGFSRPPIVHVLPLMPRRIFRENELRINHYFDELLARVSEDGQRVDFNKPTLSEPKSIESFSDTLRFANFAVFNSSYGADEDSFLRAQIVIGHACIACAIECYWLAHKAYPEALAELVPEFLPSIPQDICSAASMKYQRTGNDSFRLYSVGFNRVDDGGVLDPRQNEWSQPDIIWLYAPREAAPR